MIREEITGKNRIALILFVLALAIAAALMSYPSYRFTASVYTKKSSNTFVGDEKYTQVLAEVEEEADRFRSQGMDVEIRESVTERTNSKGEKTSLVAFSIEQTFRKTVWSFLGSDLPSSRILVVSNDGKTIGAEKLPHIFDRFYQADKTREGVGLGLAIAKAVAERNHWKLSAKSNRKTTFTLNF